MGKKDKDRKGPSLGGLAQALVNAGVADQSQAAKAESERRRAEYALGPEAIARRDAERAAEAQQARQAQAEAARAREAERGGALELAGVAELIRKHAENGRGNKRWFFVARDGRIPFVEVSDSVLRLLGDGQAGIVEARGAVPGEHAVVSDRQALAALKRFEPELVRFWNVS